MSLFFAAVFLIYTAMHLYPLLRARAAFAVRGLPLAFLSLFMLIQIMAPIIVNYTEKFGLDRTARVMAFAGYTWMWLIFLFVSSSLAVDLFRLLTTLSAWIFPWNAVDFTPSARISFLIPLIISLCITAYGFSEADNIRTERLVIRSPKIPASMGRVRIVQISDLHLGLIVREGRLKQVVEKIEREKPDIIVSTGDLVDGQICRLNGIIDLLSSLKAPYGKYAILGNHEYYAGIDQALQSTEKAGFRLLRGGTATGIIGIAGLDDPAGNDSGQYRDIPEGDLLSALPPDKFRLLLKHRPIVEESSPGLFDLQLSGHTHKGQIFPFSIIIHYLYPLDAGFGQLMKGSMLYVCRGTGTWGPPIRFLSPPEITVIDLVHGKSPPTIP
ncbi:MAG: metallophosphoesterase [Thermodesulfovibrionales bacterium]|jgi:hypothetical protein